MVDLGKPGDGGFQPTKPPPSDMPQKTMPGSLDIPSADDRMWAMLSHLMLPIAYVTVLPMILGPFVIWLLKKEESPFVDDQAKEALNFHLSVLIVGLVSICTVVGWIVVMVGALVFSIKAAMESNQGVAYRYPYTFRFF